MIVWGIGICVFIATMLYTLIFRNLRTIKAIGVIIPELSVLVLLFIGSYIEHGNPLPLSDIVCNVGLWGFGVIILLSLLIEIDSSDEEGISFD